MSKRFKVFGRSYKEDTKDPVRIEILDMLGFDYRVPEGFKMYTSDLLVKINGKSIEAQAPSDFDNEIPAVFLYFKKGLPCLKISIKN